VGPKGRRNGPEYRHYPGGRVFQTGMTDGVCGPAGRKIGRECRQEGVGSAGGAMPSTGSEIMPKKVRLLCCLLNGRSSEAGVVFPAKWESQSGSER